MITPINNINNKAIFLNKKNNIKKEYNIDTKSYELSNYSLGLSILARNNINFKGSAQPIETTHLYNKKVEGKEHLDLPNIHVYEFPDTNLRVFINQDENVITNNNDILHKPKIKLLLENTNYDNANLLKEKLLHLLLIQTNENINSSPFVISYENSYSENQFNEIEDFNKTLFNLKITEKKLENAKNSLKNLLNSKDYQSQNKKIKKLYDKKVLLNKQDVFNTISEIDIYDMNNYYQDYLKQSNYQAFVTVSPEYFAKNKEALFKTLNSQISKQVLSKDFKSEKASFEITEPKTQTYINKKNIYTVDFPIKNITSKDSIIADLTKSILNSYNQFQFEIEYFVPPLELKQNTGIKYNFTFLNIKPIKDKFIQIDKLDNFLLTFESQDLDENLDILKKNYKEYFAKTFTENESDLIKNWELATWQDSIFEIFETIDSITSKNINDFIKTYLINQNPIIENVGGIYPC